ncbi:MAG: hypothetical protein OEQ39_04505 [Gammaproteobacteria bacterium]|nr:hypothetical protein [Gammaproteobacteria bacterium]
MDTFTNRDCPYAVYDAHNVKLGNITAAGIARATGRSVWNVNSVIRTGYGYIEMNGYYFKQER